MVNIFDTIKKGIQNKFQKNKEERELMEQVRKETDIERLKIFQEELKRNSLEVAKAKAKKDAAKYSGLQKLRAENRLRNLQKNNAAPGSFFEKMRDYTQKNIAKREENLKKTEENRKIAEQLKRQRDLKMKQKKPLRSSGFGNCTWKM